MRPSTYTTAAAAIFASITDAAPAPDARHVVRDSTSSGSTGVMDGSQVAVFWGQSTGNLSDVCDDTNFDIVILSFLTSLIPPVLNLGKDTGSASTAQSAQDGWGLFDGTVIGSTGKSLAEQIQGCQSAGKKVMISFGGTENVSNATFASSDDATQAADYLWYEFSL